MTVWTDALLTQAFTRLESTLPTQDVVRTTDATVRTLATLKIPVDQVVVIEGTVSARRTGGSAGATNDGAGYAVKIVATNTGGTAAIIGSASVTTIAESQAGWNVTATVSGNSVLVQVTGAANNNITWVWSAKQLPAKE